MLSLKYYLDFRNTAREKGLANVIKDRLASDIIKECIKRYINSFQRAPRAVN